MIEATVDANEWRLELERVAPQLQVASKRDTKEWRTHVELMKTNQEVYAATAISPLVT